MGWHKSEFALDCGLSRSRCADGIPPRLGVRTNSMLTMSQNRSSQRIVAQGRLALVSRLKRTPLSADDGAEGSLMHTLRWSDGMHRETATLEPAKAGNQDECTEIDA